MAIQAAAVIPILIALGTAIAKAVPKADDIARRNRIRELQGRRLGLSDMEAERMMAQSLSPAQAAEREFLMRQGDIAATSGAVGGQLFAQQQAGQERLLKTRSGIARDLMTLDAQRAESERVELERLLGAKGKRQTEVATAAVQGAGEAATHAVGGYEEAEMLKREGLAEQGRQANAAAARAVATPTGEGSPLDSDWFRDFDEAEKRRRHDAVLSLY